MNQAVASFCGLDVISYGQEEMTMPDRPRPSKKQVAFTWREVLLSEVLPGVDSDGGRRLGAGEGNIYFNARYYDPLTGRFFTEDPSRQGVNWYAYCNNNPVNLTDPDGRITGADQAHFVAGQAEAHELAFIKRDVYWSGVRDRLDQVAEVESAVAGFVPGLGVALDIYKAAAGRDFVTQKNVSAQERVEAGVMAVMGAIPIAGRIAGKVVSTVAERNLARLSELADRFALQGGIQEVSRYGLSSARKSLGVGQQIGKLAEMTDVATTGAQLSGMGVKALK